jgi:hypothetical protein
MEISYTNNAGRGCALQWADRHCDKLHDTQIVAAPSPANNPNKPSSKPLQKNSQTLVDFVPIHSTLE